ncbi:MAG: hypothetical protein LUP94_00540 [Candidatus Methanomethylicus sp.]|nr:hypothetical protein [Candidatus Methanomethylicus sp.]
MKKKRRHHNMRVKHVSENRIYWTLGRANSPEKEEVLGIEMTVEGGLQVHRIIFARGKFGHERVIFEETYQIEEFFDILKNEAELLSGLKTEYSPRNPIKTIEREGEM